MIYLILSILTSALLPLIFKLFQKNNVDNYVAIIVNYAMSTKSVTKK